MKFTKTETRLVEVLSDGRRHGRRELLFLIDSQATPGNLYFHISNIKKKLLSQGQAIICEYYQGKYYYRQVRLLSQG